MTPPESHGIEYAGDLNDAGMPVPFKVTAPDGLDPEAADELRNTPGIEYIKSESEHQMPTVLDADGYLIRSATKPDTPERIAALERAKIITRIGVGTDNIDKQAAARNGMIVLNTPGASTKPVARRAIYFIDAWACRQRENDARLQEGEWSKKHLAPRDLSTMTLGIVGLGRIGQDVYKRAKDDELFRNILYSDPMVDIGEGRTSSLEELLRNSDVVSLHISKDDEVLGPHELSLMKEGALLVNTARGTNVNKEALLAAMSEKGIYYATDVYWKEDTEGMRDPTVTQIMQHERWVAGTQHTAASDAGTQRRLGLEGARRMIEFATRGRVRSENIASPLFPAINPDAEQERTWPGARIVIAHPSIAGQIRKIAAEIGDLEISIREFTNREGEKDDGHQLALSIADLPASVSPELAVAIMRGIEGKLRSLRGRIMWLVATGKDVITSASAAAATPEQQDAQMEVDPHHPPQKSPEPVGAL